MAKKPPPPPHEDVVRCQTCQGNGTIRVNKIVKGKSVWVTETCPARCQNGKISKRLL